MKDTVESTSTAMCRCIDSRAFMVIGSFLALVGGVCLAIFLSLTVRPYHYAKNFSEVKCVSEGYTSFDTCCRFTSKEKCDTYPCIQSRVSYSSPGGPSGNDAILYYDFQSAEFQGDNASCTFYDCPSEYDEAADELEDIIEDYARPGRNFKCYRDDDVGTIIIKRIDLKAVIHSIVWPGTIFLIGFVIAILGYCEKMGQPPPSEEDEEDLEDLRSSGMFSDNGEKIVIGKNRIGVIYDADEEEEQVEEKRKDGSRLTVRHKDDGGECSSTCHSSSLSRNESDDTKVENV